MRHAEEMDASNASMENSEEQQSKILLKYVPAQVNLFNFVLCTISMANFEGILRSFQFFDVFVKFVMKGCVAISWNVAKWEM